MFYLPNLYILYQLMVRNTIPYYTKSLYFIPANSPQYNTALHQFYSLIPGIRDKTRSYLFFFAALPTLAPPALLLSRRRRPVHNGAPPARPRGNHSCRSPSGAAPSRISRSIDLLDCPRRSRSSSNSNRSW